MRLAFAVALPSQLLLLVKPILAQTARGVLVPVGAHVKIDTESGGQSVEGTIVAWRGDTLLVQPQSRTDTVRVASGALKKLRVVESPALWRYKIGRASCRERGWTSVVDASLTSK